ncbi:MAG: restriction endonuclease-like protein [Chloroflexales bacterium]|nr:restriction endonuclease-like protein [Chloroflexales bacterium]
MQFLPNAMELLVDNRPINDTCRITEWQTVEFACTPAQGDELLLLLNGEALEPFMRPGDPAWRWRWNPQNAVGRFAVLLQATRPDSVAEELHAVIEVAPRKIDQERYTLLLDNLQQNVYGLIYTLAGGMIGIRMQSLESPPESQLLQTYVHLLDERFSQLDRAIAQIARRPRTELRPHTERVEAGQARDWRPDPSDWRSANVQAPTAHAQTPIPTEVSQARSTPSADTYENRLVKRLLDELWRRTRLIAALAQREGGRASERSRSISAIAVRCNEVTKRLHELRALPFLAEVGPLTSFHGPTPALQREPAYRVVYRFWQDVRRYPFIAVETPLFDLPIQELPRLYECWCLLQVAQALLDLPDVQVHEQKLVVAAETDFTLALVEDETLLVLGWSDLTLRLRYQPRYRRNPLRRTGGEADTTAHSLYSHPRSSFISLDRHTRIPDLAVEIERPDKPPTVVLFDAKYRLDASGGVPEDALADAYTYLGSIGLPSGERAARAAMLLFPGQGAAELYSSGVGALPLLPGAVGALQERLEQLLTS